MIATPGRTRLGCYVSNAAMAVVANLSPLLFLTFRQLYGVSYTLLGSLVVLNFCTQLGVDLLFSFFSHKFPISLTVKLMPLLTAVGLLTYAIFPALFPAHAFLFLALGTVIFSASAGLAEVLTSPVIAALPSDNPDRDMSRAHSVYAWGTAVVVLVSTLYLQLFGRENWYILALCWTVLPLLALILFLGAEIPALDTPKSSGGAARLLRNPTLALCVACIFLGGAAENTMTQWCSSYLEAALTLPKVWGDVCGTAVFAVTLGLGRTLYARRGKRIDRVLTVCCIAATVCYLAAALSPAPIVGLLACAMTGLAVSMLWPGTLIYTAEQLPNPSVAVYALLAAGGDLGGSIAPQLMGSVTDWVAASPRLCALCASLTPEQFGFRVSMGLSALFPLLGLGVVLWMRKRNGKRAES